MSETTTLAQRNVARLQDLYGEYARGNREALYAALTEDVVWRSLGGEGLAWSGDWHGREGVEAYFATIDGCAQVTAYAVERIIAQDDWLVTLATIEVRATATGQTQTYPKADVVRMRDGRIAEFREYYDTAAAVACFCAA